jgi:hypothetical protein
MDISTKNTINFEKEETTLVNNCKHVLSTLKKQALAKKMTITAKPRKGSLYVVNALNKINLLPVFLEKFREEFPAIKTYRDSKQKTLSQFIIANGGLKKTIIQFRVYLEKKRRKKRNDSFEETNYVSAVFGVCLDAFGATNRKYINTVKKRKTSLPYCSLCWRRAEKSSHYCGLHVSTYPAYKHHADKNALFSAMIAESRNDDHLFEYYYYRNNRHIKLTLLIYKWTTAFATDVRMFDQFAGSISKMSWQAVAKKILDFCQKEYPITYQCISNVVPTSHETWLGWFKQIINALDKTELKYWASNSTNNDKNFDNNDWLIQQNDGSPARHLVLLAILQRHEAYEYIQSLPQPRGPKTGYIKNEDVRKKIKNLIANYKKQKKKPNYAEMARQLDVSRQYVSKLVKEITKKPN